MQGTEIKEKPNKTKQNKQNKQTNRYHLTFDFLVCLSILDEAEKRKFVIQEKGNSWGWGKGCVKNALLVIKLSNVLCINEARNCVKTIIN